MSAEGEGIRREPSGAPASRARAGLRAAGLQLAGLVAIMLALAALWHFLPIAHLTHLGRLQAFVQALEDHWAGPFAVVGVFVLGGLVMFPLVLMIVATSLLFPPLTGLCICLAGSLLSASVGYGLGVLVGSAPLHRIAGAKLDRLHARLGRRSIPAVAAIRVLPLLPFTMVNMAAGAARIGLRDFLLGTALGLAPGILAATLFATQIAPLVRGMGLRNIVFALAILVVAVPLVISVWRRRRRRGESLPSNPPAIAPRAPSGSGET